MITTFIALVMAYLFGSLSSAIIVCRVMGLPDPRTQGSKNPGATNVLRIGGKKAALITLLGDSLKGVIPVLIGRWLGLDELSLTLIAFFAFIGHLYPIFFRFEGGKGVATFIGSLLALNASIGLIWIALWASVAVVFRYSSLAALTASLLIPFVFYAITHQLNSAFIIALMSLILVYRHQGNIKNLLSGVEGKIGKKTGQ